MGKTSRELLHSALGVFVRYGYRRTTMGDIAAAAGISRPSLYLQFNGKEAVFAAVVEMFVDDALARIRDGLPRRKALHDKLSFVFEVWTVEPFELASRSPDAEELVGLPLAGLERGKAELLVILRGLLRDSLGTRTAERTARVMVAAATGFKAAAANAEDLRRLFRDLIAMVLAQGNPGRRA